MRADAWRRHANKVRETKKPAEAGLSWCFLQEKNFLRSMSAKANSREWRGDSGSKCSVNRSARTFHSWTGNRETRRGGGHRGWRGGGLNGNHSDGTNRA